VSLTTSAAGTNRCRRRTITTASTAEQSQATSSAPLAAASSAALASGPAVAVGSGVTAASAARSAAACVAALAAASTPMSTAASPARSTNPAIDNPIRVVPPRSPGGRLHELPGSSAGAAEDLMWPGTSCVGGGRRWAGLEDGDRGGADHDRLHAERQPHRQLYRDPNPVRPGGHHRDP
jgi:hypothetical protein